MINLGLKSRIDFENSHLPVKRYLILLFTTAPINLVPDQDFDFSPTLQKKGSNLNINQDTIIIILIHQDQRFLLFGYLKPLHPHHTTTKTWA